MKKAIIDYLQLSTEQYNELIFTYYWNWCYKYASNPNKTQQLFANASVNKWFMTEVLKSEKQFMKIAQTLPNKKDVLESVFYGLMAEVFNTFPKPLIEDLNNNFDFAVKINKYVAYAN